MAALVDFLDNLQHWTNEAYDEAIVGNLGKNETPAELIVLFMSLLNKNDEEFVHKQCVVFVSSIFVKLCPT